MTGAMYAAVSGLKTHMSAMNVIGNNISNVNTVAYKATRYIFNEALYTSVRSGSNGTDQLGGRNPAQIGYGCNVSNIDLDMSTKNYTPTGWALDCMIDGDGFFIVGNDKENNGITKQSQLQGMSLSRLGNLQIDPQGYLVDGSGSLIYGYLRMTSIDEYVDAWNALPENENNQIKASDVTEEMLTSPILTPIRMPMCTITAATNDDGSQSSEKTKTTIYWPQVDGSGDEQYVRDGLYGDPTTAEKMGVQDPNAPADPPDPDATTTQPTLERLQPALVSLDSTGAITVTTKDEQTFVVGFIAIATVDNPNGVTHTDGRYFKALGGAGNVHATTIGGIFTYVAGQGTTTEDPNNPPDPNAPTWDLGSSNITTEGAGDTQLVTGGLESSGTDLAQEITNMIVIQRGYQANTRIVTVTDSMLEELVNMKR